MAFLRKIAAATTIALGTVSALPALAAELIMVEEPGCMWCARWEAELGAIYPKTAEGKAAPLRKIEIRETKDDATGIAFARPVLFTPTFVLVEDGQELGRIEGYPGEDFFWGLLSGLLEAHIGFKSVQG